MTLSNYRPNSYDLLLLDINASIEWLGIIFSNKQIDNKVKVCFISAYDIDYTALREQFPSLEIDCLIPEKIMRKPIEVSRLHKGTKKSTHIVESETLRVCIMRCLQSLSIVHFQLVCP